MSVTNITNVKFIHLDNLGRGSAACNASKTLLCRSLFGKSLFDKGWLDKYSVKTIFFLPRSIANILTMTSASTLLPFQIELLNAFRAAYAYYENLVQTLLVSNTDSTVLA